MATEVTSNGSKTKKIPYSPGLSVAGFLLEFVEGSIHIINRHKRFNIYPPSEARLKLAPHLQDRIEKFQEYAASIPPERFELPWVKFVGGVQAPPTKNNGCIHLYAFDDGLLSDAIPAVGIDDDQLAYDNRSSFILNHVFGLDVAGQRKKSRIHLHVYNVSRLAEVEIQPTWDKRSVDYMKVRALIADDHGPKGKFIKNPKYFVRMFSHKTRHPDGVSMSNFHPNLVINSSTFFEEKVPQWLLR